MAAMGIMKTISTLVISLDTSVELLGELEVTVGPVIGYVLQKNVNDLFEECFELIDSFTYCMKRITPTMWTFFPYVYKALKEDGMDYFEGKKITVFFVSKTSI